MVEQIDRYRTSRKPYPALVNELDVGVSNLLDPYGPLREQLREQWRVLEELNALALDEGQEKPLVEHEDIARRALDRFVALVQDGLDLARR
jgi:hypothetical protein